MMGKASYGAAMEQDSRALWNTRGSCIYRLIICGLAVRGLSTRVIEMHPRRAYCTVLNILGLSIVSLGKGCSWVTVIRCRDDGTRSSLGMPTTHVLHPFPTRFSHFIARLVRLSLQPALASTRPTPSPPGIPPRWQASAPMGPTQKRNKPPTGKERAAKYNRNKAKLKNKIKKHKVGKKEKEKKSAQVSNGLFFFCDHGEKKPRG